MTVLETKHISKHFPAVRANNDISIALGKGEILGLLGENGAGKSTLMNLLYGLFQPTSGEIYVRDELVQFNSPKDAIHAGLGMVHQHFMLVDTLTVTENIILGSEPSSANFIKFKQAKREVDELATRHSLSVNPNDIILNVSVGIQQRVEILKALYRKAEILILDEPTAVLTPQEVGELFEIMRSLVKSGVSIILITHKLNEIKEISDRVYIMRHGEVVRESKTNDITIQQLADEMVGRKVKLIGREINLAADSAAQKKKRSAEQKKRKASVPVLELQKVTIQNDRKLNVVNEIDLAVRNGEIVGIAGVDGNGQSELAEGIVGLRQAVAGQIEYYGADINDHSIKERIQMKIGYVPADRHKYGLVLPFTLSENMTLGMHDTAQFSSRGVLNFSSMDDYSKELVKSYDVRPTAVHNIAGNLSGGNQQKLILAREFSRKPSLMIISQPTRGLDIGAIEYIHQQIRNMRTSNVAILLISLELEEIFALSDRILVLHKGQIVHEADPDTTTESEIGFYMLGGEKSAATNAPGKSVASKSATAQPTKETAQSARSKKK